MKEGLEGGEKFEVLELQEEAVREIFCSKGYQPLKLSKARFGTIATMLGKSPKMRTELILSKMNIPNLRVTPKMELSYV